MLKKSETKQYFIEGFKTILKYLEPRRKTVYLLIILAIFTSLINAVAPYLIGRFFDALIAKKMNLAINLIGIWFIFQLVGNITDWQYAVKKKKMVLSLYADYLANGFSHLLKLPYSFHKKMKTGEINDKINRAANFIHFANDTIITQTFPEILTIIIALVIAFSINKILTLIMIVSIVVYVLTISRIAPKTVKLQKEARKTYRDGYNRATDGLDNVLTVKQATAEEYERKKLYEIFKIKALAKDFQLEKLWELITFSQRIIVVFAQLSIFALSILFVFKNKLTPGELVMFNSYAFMLFRPFVTLGTWWQEIQNGVIALNDSEKLLGLETEKYLSENPVIIKEIQGKVEFKNVSFAYGKKHKPILNNINFEVMPGETAALVGESGMGKTTLIDLISLYFPPSSGEILIDGHNGRRLDLKFLRGAIAVVPQEPSLFNDTIKNNIKYGNFEASDEEIIEAARLAHCREFIEKFPEQYNQIVGWRGIKLSTGQKQRITIARAFLRNPKILILDEPTSALDAKSEKFIQESLEKLMKGRTTFIIAHRLSTVRKADKILVLHEGKITEQGKHEELIQVPNGVYRNLYELQIGLK